MANEQTSVRGIVFVTLSACTFALAGILIKLCSWSSLSINGLRCLFAAFVMAGYMAYKKHRFVVNVPVLFTAAVNLGMGLLFVMANKMTTAANAIVLQFTMPAFIIVLQRIFWKIRPDRYAVAACVISFAGIVCFFLESLSGGGVAGNLLAVASGLLYAILFLSKKIPGCDFESAVLISFIGSFLMGIPALAAEPVFFGTDLLLVFVLGVVQVGCSYIFLNIGLDLVPPVTASLLSMLEPILNPVLVAVFYHERMGWMSLVGAVIVLGSAAWYNTREAMSRTTHAKQ